MGHEPTETKLRQYRPGDGPGERAGVPCVEVLTGKSRGRVIRLAEEETTIGRRESSGVFLRDDGVSRDHARIVVRGAEVRLVDQRSTNGCFVNDKRVRTAVLAEGDLLQIGPDVRLRFAHWDEAALPAEHVVATLPPLPLTKREAQVAELVADGLKNVEIAQRLSISERTVTTHLTRVYDRLSLSGRAELIRAMLHRRAPTSDA